MAAYYCPDCEVSYPKHKAFNYCPECNSSTKYTPGRPSMTTEEAAFILAKQEFDRWSDEHRRSDETVRTAVIFAPGIEVTDMVVNEAFDVIAMLENHAPQMVVGELYVL